MNSHDNRHLWTGLTSRFQCSHCKRTVPMARSRAGPGGRSCAPTPKASRFVLAVVGRLAVDRKLAEDGPDRPCSRRDSPDPVRVRRAEAEEVIFVVGSGDVSEAATDPKGQFFTKRSAQDGESGACGALLPGEPNPPQTPSPPHTKPSGRKEGPNS